VIASATNGYCAGAGYNLVTGLGTPVASRPVPDLVAYQGPGTSYGGPTVACLQYSGLAHTGPSGGGPMDVFSVFDSSNVAINGPGGANGQISSTDLSSPVFEMRAPAVIGRASASPLITSGFPVGPASNLGPAGLIPTRLSSVTITPAQAGLLLGIGKKPDSAFSFSRSPFSVLRSPFSVLRPALPPFPRFFRIGSFGFAENRA